jgi:hypothetical protein
MMTGFGVDAVNPYMAFSAIQRLVDDGQLAGVEYKAAVGNYVKAAGKGMLKVMAKMGVSTLQASFLRCTARHAIHNHCFGFLKPGLATRDFDVALDVARALVA